MKDEEKHMINLGIFPTNDGKRYIGHFLSENNIVELFGPLQNHPYTGGAPRVFNPNS